MEKKICCIFNLAPHYNTPIYKLIDKEIGCDFYFGDKLHLPIKLMNYDDLTGYKKTLKNIFFGSFYWQVGALKLIFKPYTHYIITGEPYSISNWLIMIIAKFYNKKIILWSHGFYGNENIIKVKIKKFFFNLAHSVMLYGNYARNIMIKEGIKENKLHVIYNSLDYEKQLIYRKSIKSSDIFINHFNNNYSTVIFVGRIQKNKKVGLLIDAVQKLLKEGKNCNLVIVGNEVETINLHEKVNKNFTNNIWLYGPCYDEIKLGELIYNSSLCVIPGDIGLSIMHSFVYGTPVITNNNFSSHGPEFEAIIRGKTGDFFVENSLQDLCNKILNWIFISGKEKFKIRQNCFKIIEDKYNPKAQLEFIKRALK
tara:strand:- start:328 stop:1428 length:1101 start_codon:yes stop_codon:yes gene_type:complete